MRTLILALLVIAALAYAFFYLQGDRGADTPGTDEPAVTDPADADGPATPDDAAPETQSLPRFDIVRVDRNGYATFAGRAEPGSQVEVLANGEVILTEEADARGEFAGFIETPLSAGPVELSLRMTTPDGLTVTSADTIIIYVPESDEDLPVVLRTTPGGATEILQRADDPDPALGPLRIEAIDYDDAGNAIFSGRAEPNSVVQIFANNQPVGETSSDESGRWSLSTTIPQGRYTLLVVQLDADGDPKYAVEVPFEQASRDDIVLRDGKVIVQPGNSLWVISRTVYGEGRQYTVIYDANADQIRDPDLIYPGQVFRVPDEDDDGADDGGDDQ